MSIKKLIGYLLLALLIIGMTAGLLCIFHFRGGFTVELSMLFVLGIYAATALLTLLIISISYLLCD